MNIRQAYIETKSAKKKAEHIPPTGFKNIHIVNGNIQVRDRQISANWTDIGTNHLMNNTIGNYRMFRNLVSATNVYYVSCGWTRNSSPMYAVFISEGAFSFETSDWQNSWSTTTAHKDETTGLYLTDGNDGMYIPELSYFTSWQTSACAPKYYGEGLPAYWLSRIKTDFLS